MLLNLTESDHFWAKAALNPERVNDLFHYPRCTSYLYVLVTHRAILVEYQPVLNAQLAEQLVAVVTFLGIAAHF